MFVSKKKYNEALIELIDTRTELKHKEDELAQVRSQIYEINGRVSKIENQTIAEGKRLTEEELSTLIAVDFIRLINEDIRPVVRTKQVESLFALHADLVEGILS